MGDTGANMASWGGLYGGGAPATTEATVVTTAAAVSSPTSGGSGGSPTRAQAQQHAGVGVEGGRVGKPARRRSRASRRAPVTLLNTDTSNFRAMVQQFTGIPAGPYGPGVGGGGVGVGGGPVISFGGGEYGGAPQLVRPSPTSAVMSFDHLAAAHAHAHRPAATSLQSQFFRPQHQYGGGGGDVGGYGGMHGGGGDGMAPSSFLHGGGGFESSAEDRLLLQSMMQAAQTTMPTAAGRPASTNNGNGYNFG